MQITLIGHPMKLISILLLVPWQPGSPQDNVCIEFISVLDVNYNPGSDNSVKKSDNLDQKQSEYSDGSLSTNENQEDSSHYRRNCSLDCKPRSVSISPNKLSDCLNGYIPQLSFRVTREESMVIDLLIDNSSGLLDSNSSLKCELKFFTSEDTHALVLVVNQTCSEDVYFVRTGPKNQYFPLSLRQLKWDSCYRGAYPGDEIAYNLPTKTFGFPALMVQNLSGQYRARLYFQAVLNTPGKYLQLRYVSSIQGYIQNQYFEPVNLYFAFVSYCDSVDEWIRVTVPYENVVMLSLVTASLRKYLTLLTIAFHYNEFLMEVSQGNRQNKMWIIDGLQSLHPEPRVLHTRELNVRFVSRVFYKKYASLKARKYGQSLSGFGFRILFTFHEVGMRNLIQYDYLFDVAGKWAD